MIITIDGPSGTGKTTVARKVADRLHFIYFDTGAMYRCFTWFVLENNVDIADSKGIEDLLNRFAFNISEISGEKHYFVGDQDVTEIIRSRPVTAHVSAVSALQEVRSFLLIIQHRFAEKRNVVFEGRDLGTVVFPDAELKVFLTADPQIRAERRMNEIVEKHPQEGQNLTREQMLADIQQRDEYDSTRKIAPLRCPADAFQIDTSHLSIDQVVDLIVEFFIKHRSKKLKPAWARKISMTWLYRAVLFLVWIFFKTLYRHKVYGLQHYYSQAAVIASNHCSNYDPCILAISWPEEVHFLAREGLFKNPAFSWLIRNLNAHPVSGDAGDIVVFKLICRLLNEGKKIILFPEGTRGIKDELGPLKSGIAMLVSRTKTAVVPAYIHGTFSLWNRQRKFPKLWGKTACVFGTPILWEQFAQLDKREAQNSLTEKLAEAIQRLRAWYEAGAKGNPP